MILKRTTTPFPTSLPISSLLLFILLPTCIIFSFLTSVGHCLRSLDSVPLQQDSIPKFGIQDPLNPYQIITALQSSPTSTILRFKTGDSREAAVVDSLFFYDGETDLVAMHLFKHNNGNDKYSLAVILYDEKYSHLKLIHVLLTRDSMTRVSEKKLVLDSQYFGPSHIVTTCIDPMDHNKLFVLHTNEDGDKVLSEIQFQEQQQQPTTQKLETTHGFTLIQNTVINRPNFDILEQGFHLLLTETNLIFIEKRLGENSVFEAPRSNVTQWLPRSKPWTVSGSLKFAFQKDYNSGYFVVQDQVSSHLIQAIIPSLNNISSLIMPKDTIFTYDRAFNQIHSVLQDRIAHEDFYGLYEILVSVVDLNGSNGNSMSIRNVSRRYDGPVSIIFPLNNGTTNGVYYVGFSTLYFNSGILFATGIMSDKRVVSRNLGGIAGPNICSFYSQVQKRFYVVAGSGSARISQYKTSSNKLFREKTFFLPSVLQNVLTCGVDTTGRYVFFAYSSSEVAKFDLTTMSIVAKDSNAFIGIVQFLHVTKDFVIIGTNGGLSVFRMGVEKLKNWNVINLPGTGMTPGGSTSLSKDSKYLYLPFRTLDPDVGLSLYPLNIPEMKLYNPIKIVDYRAAIMCSILTDEHLFLSVSRGAGDRCTILRLPVSTNGTFGSGKEFQIAIDTPLEANCLIDSCFASKNYGYGYFTVYNHKTLFSVGLRSKDSDKIKVFEQTTLHQKIREADTDPQHHMAYLTADDRLYLYDIQADVEYRLSRGIKVLISFTVLSVTVVVLGVLAVVLLRLTKCIKRRKNPNGQVSSGEYELMHHRMMSDEDIPQVAHSHITSL